MSRHSPFVCARTPARLAHARQGGVIFPFAITYPHLNLTGYLYRPIKGFDKKLKEHVWVVEAWEWIVRRALGLLIAPFTSDASRWFDLEWVNLYEEDGKTCRLARPGHRLPSEAEAKTYGDIVSQYRWHREAKSLAPDGRPCADNSAGGGVSIHRQGDRSPLGAR